MIRFASLSDADRRQLNDEMVALREQGYTSTQLEAWFASKGIRRPAHAIAVWLARNHVKVDLDSAEPAPDPVDLEAERLKNREMIRTLTELQRSEAKRREYVAAIRDVLQPVEPTPLLPLHPHDAEMPVHMHVLVFSDWHVGQRTPIEHTGGLYEQTTEVTKWQVDRLLRAYRSIFDVESHGQQIEELMLLFIGDLVEGDSMRPAQLRAIDLAVTKQVVEVFNLAEYIIRQLLTFPGIKRIRAHFVGGNHDRTTSRPGNAGLGESDYVDTYSWLIGALMERFFQDDPRVRVINWETFFGYDVFAGRRFAFEHGASFRGGVGSYGGIPWYPISNAAGKYQQMLDGADFVVMGHFHRGAILPMGQGGWVVMNGSLPATTHFVQSSFKSIREPMQWLLDLHADHGLVAGMPIYAVPDTLSAEGEAWRLAAERNSSLWTPTGDA